jgi:hypothetical protein
MLCDLVKNENSRTCAHFIKYVEIDGNFTLKMSHLMNDEFQKNCSETESEEDD